MDPKTGIFHQETAERVLPAEWPRFSEGEELEIKGVPFVIQRVNRSTLVLRPVPVDELADTATRLMRRYTGE